VKYFEVFLAFVTLWILIIAGVVYLTHRRRPAFTGGRGPASQACCLEVPCSADCAREHQRLRDPDAVEYHKIVRELGHLVQAGRELGPSPAPTLIAPPGDWPDDDPRN
jgi:hypothetical protein